MLLPLQLVYRLALGLRQVISRLPDTGAAHPAGIVFQGGDLSLEMLLACYSRGIFPWFNEDQPKLWWSPNPRCMMEPERYHLPRRAARGIRRAGFAITLDADFPAVLRGCADRPSTWLSEEMQEAYQRLHDVGYAHSVEAWQDGRLVGGLYGVALGRAFFGESMFHIVPEASRACMAALNALLRLRGVTLLDCQQDTPHVLAQGAVMVPRSEFERRLGLALAWDPESPDALTAEYLGHGPMEVMWPWLPWATRYVHENGVWSIAARERVISVFNG